MTDDTTTEGTPVTRYRIHYRNGDQRDVTSNADPVAVLRRMEYLSGLPGIASVELLP